MLNWFQKKTPPVDEIVEEPEQVTEEPLSDNTSEYLALLQGYGLLREYYEKENKSLRVMIVAALLQCDNDIFIDNTTLEMVNSNEFDLKINSEKNGLKLTLEEAQVDNAE